MEIGKDRQCLSLSPCGHAYPCTHSKTLITKHRHVYVHMPHIHKAISFTLSLLFFPLSNYLLVYFILKPNFKLILNWLLIT